MIYPRRLIRKLSSREHIFFVHIAKCGGKSVSAALRRRFPFNSAGAVPRASVDAAHAETPAASRDDVLRFREHLVLYHMACDVGLIAGHFAFSDMAARVYSHYKAVTLLREPVARYLSSYAWRTRSDASEPLTQSLEEFVEAGKGGDSYVHHIGGVRPAGDYHTREALDAAIANLSRFAVVGLLEDLPGFERQLRERCGLRVRIGHRNKTPAAKRQTISAGLRRKIEAICANDAELYRAATGMLP